MFEQWICAQDSQGNPGCGFIIVMGVGGAAVPQKCPKCGGRAWDVLGDARYCRSTKGAHVWRKGVDRAGMPHLDVDQACEACGAVPVLQGAGN
jgi:hypothetical protein